MENKITDLITLKLEGNRTQIYIKNRKIIQCKRLMFNITPRNIDDLNEITSIDDIINLPRVTATTTPEILSRKMTPEEEFWGHCSNIQAWVENDYNPTVLHSVISLTLLKELYNVSHNIKFLEVLLEYLDIRMNELKDFPQRRVIFLSRFVYNSQFIRMILSLPREVRMSSPFIIDTLKNEKVREHISLEINIPRERIDKRYRARLRYHEKKIYPDEDYHELRYIRNNRNSVSDPQDYPAFLWSKENELWDEFSKDGRTANYKSCPSGATHYYILYTWTERVNRSRAHGFSFTFEHARVICRFEDGTYKAHNIRL